MGAIGPLWNVKRLFRNLTIQQMPTMSHVYTTNIYIPLGKLRVSTGLKPLSDKRARQPSGCNGTKKSWDIINLKNFAGRIVYNGASQKVAIMQQTSGSIFDGDGETQRLSCRHAHWCRGQAGFKAPPPLFASGASGIEKAQAIYLFSGFSANERKLRFTLAMNEQ